MASQLFPQASMISFVKWGLLQALLDENVKHMAHGLKCLVNSHIRSKFDIQFQAQEIAKH